MMSYLVEHEIGNLRITSSSPALSTGRNGLFIHPVAKWVPDIDFSCMAIIELGIMYD